MAEPESFIPPLCLEGEELACIAFPAWIALGTVLRWSEGREWQTTFQQMHLENAGKDYEKLELT